MLRFEPLKLYNMTQITHKHKLTNSGIRAPHFPILRWNFIFGTDSLAEDKHIGGGVLCGPYTANLQAKILDFRGFDSSMVLTSRGGILMATGTFPEMPSQAILAGIISAGRLSVRN